MASAHLKLKLLVQYGDLWFVKMRVPVDVQASLGKKVLTKTTGETDPVKAHRKAEPIIAAWKDAIRVARAGGKTALQTRLSAARARFRRLQELERRDPDGVGDGDPWQVVEDLLEQELGIPASDLQQEQMEAEGYGPVPAPVLRKARRFVEEVIGEATPFLSNQEGWKNACNYKPRQLTQAVRDVVEFAEAHPDLTLEGLTGAMTQAWVEARVSDPIEPLSKKTVERKLSALRNYWRWLQAHEIVPSERKPFSGVRVPDRRRDKGADDERRAPWEPAEIVRLHSEAHARGDEDLADLIWLAAHTGARIEELCGLTASHVAGDVLTVPGTKSNAAARKVPVHSAVKDLLERLAEDAQGKDRWLIHSTAKNQYDDRSPPLGQRFSRLKTSLGHGPDKVFHSIRKTVATLLEDAGCPEGVAADLLGHDKPTMTYGLYSGGASMTTRSEWLEKAVRYPAPRREPT